MNNKTLLKQILTGLLLTTILVIFCNNVLAKAQLPDVIRVYPCVSDIPPAPYGQKDVLVKDVEHYKDANIVKVRNVSENYTLEDEDNISSNIPMQPAIKEVKQDNQQPISNLKQNAIEKVAAVDDKLPLEVKGASTISDNSTLNSIISSTALVVILAVVFLWIMSQLMKAKPDLFCKTTGKEKSSSSNKPRLKILSTTSLGQGKTLHLIEVNGIQVIIGSTPNSLSMLSVMNQNSFITPPPPSPEGNEILKEFNKINQKDKKEDSIEKDNTKYDKNNDNDNVINLDGYSNLYKKYLNP